MRIRIHAKRHPEAFVHASRVVWIAAVWSGLVIGAAAAALFEPAAPAIIPAPAGAAVDSPLPAPRPEATMTGLTPNDPTGGESQPPTF